jgi:crossover junction endodeoxyribonuclease RuvC
VRIFGIDPGSVRTGYGCVETDGTRHRLVTCGALVPAPRASVPERLRLIHNGLSDLLRTYAPESVAIETLFHARNVRSALLLGHARGVAVLAAVEAGVPMAEYSPAEIKVAVTGYGRAEKAQLQHMIKLLLGLDRAPSPPMPPTRWRWPFATRTPLAAGFNPRRVPCRVTFAAGVMRSSRRWRVARHRDRASFRHAPRKTRAAAGCRRRRRRL